MTTVLANAKGANKTVSDYTLGLSSDGELVTPECEVREYRANATITKGQALMWVAPTTTVPVSVTPMTAAADNRYFAGVAMNGQSAGGIVQVCIEGHVLVNVGSGTPAAADYVMVPENTTGVFDADATPDAGADTPVGIFWGVKNSASLAFAYINRNGLPEVFKPS